MRGGLVAIIFLIVVGVMLANILRNVSGTKTVFDGITQLWSTSVNGLLGKSVTSKSNSIVPA